RYSLRSPALSGPPIDVIAENQNVENIKVPISMNNFTGQLKVEGVSGSEHRAFAFIVGDDSGVLTSSISCEPDGTFRVVLPQGSLRVSLAAAGHKVKAFSYGSQDLLRDKTTTLTTGNSNRFEVTLVPDVKSSEPQVIYQVLPEDPKHELQTDVHGPVEL